MAKRPGAFDLRCNESVLSAMLAHPRYRHREDFLAWGADMVHNGNWAFARHLPTSDARRALDAVRGHLVARQSRSGLWFRKHAEEWSYPILVALERAGLLREWIGSRVLRYDPLAPFANRDDMWGALVRRNVMRAEEASDREQRARLIGEIIARQSSKGSWDDSVAATALETERLLDLGEPTGAPALVNAGQWLLSQHRETVVLPVRTSKNLTARNLFTAHHAQEHHAAQVRHPHMMIARSCFTNAPMIQTALALRALLALGLGADPRVERAFECLLDLRLEPGESPSGTGCCAGRFGEWCAHQVCFKLEDRLSAGKSRKG